MTLPRQGVVSAFGILVRARRTTAGISQEELADRCHLDRTYISGIERGVRNPSLTALFALAQGFGITVADLLSSLEQEATRNG